MSNRDIHLTVSTKLAKEIGAEEAYVYSALLSNYNYFKEQDELDDDGYFYCTLAFFEAVYGITRRKQERIFKLLQDKKLIDIKVANGAKRRIKVCLQDEDELRKKRELNSLVLYFTNQYNDNYLSDEEYKPTKSELKVFQDIIDDYTLEEWKEMIRVFIKSYDYSKWKSSEYPVPTIFGLTRPHILEGLKAMCS